MSMITKQKFHQYITKREPKKQHALIKHSNVSVQPKETIAIIAFYEKSSFLRFPQCSQTSMLK
jgi:hypothetical protein